MPTGDPAVLFLPDTFVYTRWGPGALGIPWESAADSDGDNTADYWDNCPETYNSKQFDTDQDGYGNACDCDIDGNGGNGVVGVSDLAIFRAAYRSDYTSDNWNADADFNGDLAVNSEDLAIFRSRYRSSEPFE